MHWTRTLTALAYGEDEDMVFAFKYTSIVHGLNGWMNNFSLFLVIGSLNIGRGEMLDILLAKADQSFCMGGSNFYIMSPSEFIQK